MPPIPIPAGDRAPGRHPGAPRPSPAPGQSAQSGGIIPSLDGLRAVSITIVFLTHAGVSNLVPGGFGVTVFFFLSGYLITTLLAREFDRFGFVAYRAFYIRRAVRLLPPLLLTLALSLVLALWGLTEGRPDPMGLISKLLFFYNYYNIFVGREVGIHGTSILWSLAVEEHFYFVFPVIFVAFARGRLNIPAVIVLLVLILAWRGLRHAAFGDSAWTIYIATDTRFDSLIYGCLLALMSWRGHMQRLMPIHWKWPLLAGALVALLASFLIRDEFFRSTLRYSLQGLALMAVFRYAVACPGSFLFRPLNWTIVRWIGVYSYTIYLVHLLVIQALERLGMAEGNKLVFVLSAALLSVAYAACIHAWVERPLKAVRARASGHA